VQCRRKKGAVAVLCQYGACEGFYKEKTPTCEKREASADYPHSKKRGGEESESLSPAGGEQDERISLNKRKRGFQNRVFSDAAKKGGEDECTTDKRHPMGERKGWAMRAQRGKGRGSG